MSNYTALSNVLDEAIEHHGEAVLAEWEAGLKSEEDERSDDLEDICERIVQARHLEDKDTQGKALRECIARIACFMAAKGSGERGIEGMMDIMDDAFDQASFGKGKERHGEDKPFEDQTSVKQCRTCEDGIGFATGQARKKLRESLRLPTVARRKAERLGAIVYLAMGVLAGGR